MGMSTCAVYSILYVYNDINCLLTIRERGRLVVYVYFVHGVIINLHGIIDVSFSIIACTMTVNEYIDHHDEHRGVHVVVLLLLLLFYAQSESPRTNEKCKGNLT